MGAWLPPALGRGAPVMLFASPLCRTRNRCVNTQQLPRESGAASSGSIQAGATQLRGQGATGQSRSGATGNVVGCDFWEPGVSREDAEVLVAPRALPA